ncbi:hypothetical protein RhiirC2_747786 [Rhizophagus irregularis]|uniref:MATA-HMG n=1 Tax=Rhizophagus irregularis TaxID=588596 RepID=R9UBK1_9GLOM|nr:MATA_HMG [Rhizophagus irregularis]ANQ33032.1 MATA-HMG [Rhizophagus irregularis]ANQ33035.1 MATA-HMG [Rhizophagus irregularis]PKK69760.1 hypothetical protein RhiirC2_747786 [Rhizophagus irregularis]PKY51041.1 hypothetical protein RhiirA4_407084 [Rhizophagus irregularis]
MSQEGNINSIELTNNQYEEIYRNIQVNFPNKLSFNDLYQSNHSRNGRYRNRTWRIPNAFIIFRRELLLTLFKYKIYKIRDLSKFASQKWLELPDDIRQRYKNFCDDAREYHDYRISPPTYQLIKF